MDRYAVVVLTLILVTAFLDIPIYINTVVDAIPPKYIYFIYAILIAPILLMGRQSVGAVLGVPLVRWIFIWVTLNVAHLIAAIAFGELDRAAMIGTNIQLAILAMLIIGAIEQTPPGAVLRSFPLVVIMTTAMVAYDFSNPGELYSLEAPGAVIGRGAGTFVNPNRAGEVLLLAFLLGLPAGGRVGLLMIAGVGAVLTLSRAAIGAWALLWGLLALMRYVPRASFAVLVGVVIALPLLLGVFESYLLERDDLAAGIDNIQERLDFFRSRSLEDDSAVERRDVLQAGIDLFLEKPLLGGGAELTQVWTHVVSTHNSIVKLACEFGVFGIAMWAWLLWLVVRGRYFGDGRMQIVAMALVVLLSMFTHNIPDSLYWMLSLYFLSASRPMPGRNSPDPVATDR